MEHNATTNHGNPFVGLRPFNSDESLLFFGRREQTVELLEKLHAGRLLAVVGSSGCGKSSLVRAGLIPKLKGGFLVAGCDQWRIATLKPGDAPLSHLATALLEMSGAAATDAATFVEDIRTNGIRAIHERLAPVFDQAEANLLLLVDQFEEIFRFGLESKRPEQREEAADFVALLLQLAEQRQLPIYIVLTMRSDFLGDCDHFHGLPEALNRSQYLVPRLTREQRRQAIEGPVRLFGSEIAPRLLDRLLNDVGDQTDQLPVLQHALMRTWERWEFDEADRKRYWLDVGKAEHEIVALPLDVPLYEAVGKIQRALTWDAEAALKGIDVALTERIFRALTATDANNRKIRRPAHVSELCAITGAKEEEVRKIIERFSADHRSFLLMSNEADPLVDISHESLIRQWPRMDEWMRAESDSAELFKRLLVAARRQREFWRGKDLAEAREWRTKQQPNPAWAKRYDEAPDALDTALGFLEQSEKSEDQILADEKARKDAEAARQKRELRRAKTFAAVISVALLLALGLAWYAYRQQRHAQAQTQLAKEQEHRSRVLLYGTNMYFAAKAFDEKNDVRGNELLNAFLPALNQPAPSAAEDVRGFDWYYLWLRSHPLLLTLKGLGGRINSVAYAPDGQTLASAGADGTVKVWSAQSRQELATLKGHAFTVRSLAYAPDGKTLASASDDGTVKVWDARSGQELVTLKDYEARLLSVVYAPDGKTLASGGADGRVKVWSAQSGQELMTLKGDTSNVNAVAYTLDGKMLASAGADGIVKIWSAQSGHELMTLKGHADNVMSVAYAPDGQTLASADAYGTVKVWNVRNRRELMTLKGHTDSVWSVAYAPDGKTLASGSDDGTVKVWDIRSGQELATLKGHIGSVNALAYAPDGQTLASAGTDGTVKLWNARSGQEVIPLRGHVESVNAVMYAPDGQALASASDDGTVKVWDAQIGQELVTLKGHTSKVLSVAYAPDGQTLASAGADGTVKVWDIRSGQELATLKGHIGSVNALAYAPDGQTLASAGADTKVKVWSARNGQELITLKGHMAWVMSVAYAPDGRRLASVDFDGKVKVWDARSGQESVTLKGHADRVLSVAYAPDGQTLVSAGADGTVKVWSARSGQELMTLKGHVASVGSVTYAPDGKTLASASDDGTVKVWDARSGQESVTLKGHADRVLSVAYAPDGRTLASGGGGSAVVGDDFKPDFSIRLWRAATDEEVARQRNQ
jgi:WD40 repeat protein/ABC-type oligopeptide transport system ATPase subunit